MSAPRANSPHNYNTHADFGHSLVMTHDPVSGTNQFWDFGDNTYGEMGITTTVGSGNATNNPSNCGSEEFVSIPTNVQFCTRCQREVQLGTAGMFTAQCNGTLYLYLNTDNHSPAANGTNAFSATVSNLAANVAVSGINTNGVPVGSVTIGNVYTFSASGYCQRDQLLNLVDPNGNPPSGPPPNCHDTNVINIINAPCPYATCFSLVGRIQ